ncbi:MAG: hypothetical protein HY673_23325 [Chloroflexi bacterium]|nr:hypothetical protein [Chloroflexota bacterium]
MLVTPNVVLLSISAFGGHIPGMTLLQKRLYFTGELIGRYLGYRAHYYGPYSDEVADAVLRLENLGFVEERVLGMSETNDSGFETTRYDYRLSDDSTDAVQWLREDYSEEASAIESAAMKVLDAGNLEYIALSLAAELHWILLNRDHWNRNRKSPISGAEIASEVRSLPWVTGDENVLSAMSFLERLGGLDHAGTSVGGGRCGPGVQWDSCVRR